MELLRGVGKDADGVRRLGGQLADVLPAQVSENLAHIMDTVNEVAEADFGLEFDPTLVRGMSYYTGTIFEISMEGFGGSVAGGGRYDKMIGKFTGMAVSYTHLDVYKRQVRRRVEGMFLAS